MDGSNPGTFEAQLERTRATLNAPNTSWPPGTLSFESRHYVILSRELTWPEAAKLARLAEGHLAVPSDQAESVFLIESVQSSLPADGAAWIGGQHNGRAWAWITGEPWTFASWRPGSPNGDATTDTALRIVGGDTAGWDDASPADPGAGPALIIEWSTDLSNPRTATLPTATGELGRLRKIGLATVAKRYEKSTIRPLLQRQLPVQGISTRGSAATTKAPRPDTGSRSTPPRAPSPRTDASRPTSSAATCPLP